MRIYVIQKQEAGQRLDKYLKKRLNKAPASFLYKMLRKKNITLNEKKADGSEKLSIGDQVKMFLSDDTILKFMDTSKKKSLDEQYPYAELSVLYETEDVLMINKPAGMLSQKAKPEDVSANEHIIRYLLDTKKITATDLETFRPSICNRLDRNTSGILIAGKSLKGLQDMSLQLRARMLEKHYLCLVIGIVENPATIRGWLTKDVSTNRVSINEAEKENGSFIETTYVPQTRYGMHTEHEKYTLLDVQLVTGRTHQIRAHLSMKGHPILGDTKYGNKKENQKFEKSCRLHRQLLHAHRIILKDGTTITAPLYEDFNRVIEYLK